MPYHLVWQFETDAERQADFEAAYGAEGAWTRLFRQGDGYLDSTLLKAMGDGYRYVTIDRWVSRGSYDAFRLRHAAEYTALDARCELLTSREAFLGDGDGQ